MIEGSNNRYIRTGWVVLIWMVLWCSTALADVDGFNRSLASSVVKTTRAERIAARAASDEKRRTERMFLKEVAFTKQYLKKLNISRFERFGCGSWQQRYGKLHANILAGRSPPRFLISIAPPQGLADRISGMVTQFIFALITKRAFLHVAPSTSPPMDDVYYLRNIESKMPVNFMFDDDLLMNLTFAEYPSWVDKNKVVGMYLNAGSIKSQYLAVEKRNREVYLESDFNTIPADYAHTKQLYVTGNRGYSFAVFQNDFHRQQLIDMGLRQETTFKCIFDYMFKLRPESCDRSCQSIKRQILHEKAMGSIVIGVQVRVGDVAFNKDFDLLNATAMKSIGVKQKPAQSSFQCARKLARQVENAGRKAMYYFISDSRQLRKVAKKFFGSQLITDELAEPAHIFENVQDSRSAQIKALRSSASDIHLFSLAHLHVITRTSGFGQKAAFLSDQSNKIHVFYGDQGSKCSLGTHESPEHVVINWSGV